MAKDYTELKERLKAIAEMHPGAPLPTELAWPNNWGKVLSILTKDALAAIEELETR